MSINDKSVIDGISKIVDQEKRIDVVVNNAGFALVGAFEETSTDEIRAQFETNQLFWSCKSNADSNTNNEKTTTRTKHKSLLL